MIQIMTSIISTISHKIYIIKAVEDSQEFRQKLNKILIQAEIFEKL